MKRIVTFSLCLCLALSMTCGVMGAEDEVRTAKTYTFSENITEWDTLNSDVEGWLYIQGTNINYPVIFYPKDSFHYVSLGYDKQYSKNGVIYAESTTKTGPLKDMSLNTVLYGHNWTNVSATPRLSTATDVMFAQLPAFHYLDFAAQNQFINYANEDGAYVFQVFAVFYTEVSFIYYRPDPTKEQFDEMMSGIRARSIHNYDLDVEYGDKIITLSTCTRAFGKSADQRFVVMGKMVPAGTGSVTVTANPEFQKPSL